MPAPDTDPATNSHKHHILVTGMPRSGTTWLGRMLATSDQVQYVQEPFHIGFDDGLYKTNFTQYLHYVSDTAGTEHHQSLRDLFSHRSRLRERLQTGSPRRLARGVRREAQLLLRRLRRQRLLVKDPSAVFSCEWLAANFDLQVVIVVRHPAAVVCSWLDQSWQSGPEPFLAQQQLMTGLLTDSQPELESFAGQRCSPFDSAIFHWNAIHRAVLQFRRRHSDWIIIRHEDLSANPVQALAELFRRLGLDFTPSAEEQIRYHSESRNLEGPVGQVRRNSRELVSKWLQKLSRDQIDEIERRTNQIASEFYGEETWAPSAPRAGG